MFFLRKVITIGLGTITFNPDRAGKDGLAMAVMVVSLCIYSTCQSFINQFLVERHGQTMYVRWLGLDLILNVGVALALSSTNFGIIRSAWSRTWFPSIWLDGFRFPLLIVYSNRQAKKTKLWIILKSSKEYQISGLVMTLWVFYPRSECCKSMPSILYPLVN